MEEVFYPSDEKIDVNLSVLYPGGYGRSNTTRTVTCPGCAMPAKWDQENDGPFKVESICCENCGYMEVDGDVSEPGDVIRLLGENEP